MSQVRVVYLSEPSFPVTDQHPQAARYTVWSAFLGREVIVDALGGKPSTEEVDAVLNPPAKVLTVREKLAALGLTPEDIRAAVDEAQ